MIIDEKGKLFGKLSVVDILVALIIIAAIAVVAFKVVGIGQGTSASMVNCQYTMTVKNVRIESVNAIEKSIGGDLFDSKGNNIGKVKEIAKVAPYEAYEHKADGTIVKVQVPERYEISFKVEGKAAKSSSSYLLGGKTEVSNASQLTVSTENITVETVISDITTENPGEI